MLHDRSVHIEAKPFAVGVRIEHPQSWIDKARYGPNAGNPILGRPAYSLSYKAGNGRTAYSFCMCSRRHGRRGRIGGRRRRHQRHEPVFRAERNANSGIVVDISPSVTIRAARWPASPSSGIGRPWPMSPAARATRHRGRSWAISWRAGRHGISARSFLRCCRLMELVSGGRTKD